MAAAIAVAAAAGIAGCSQRSASSLTLYGNVDLRQVSLAFNGNERIAEVLAKEGDHVRKGELLAKLDTSRLEPQAVKAEAEADAQRAVVDKLLNGNRPEEIAQARANLTAAKADALNAQLQYRRLTTLVKRKLASQQEADAAKAAMDAEDARVVSAQKALDLEIAGPRKEDIAQAQAQLRALEAQSALLHRQLEDANLVAPLDAVIRVRLLEPGDMASPQNPVFSLAIIDPKWVRAYVSETDLGLVRPGLEASVGVDAFPNRRFPARIGFISPVAEFTPKTVQTEALRTSLVYEVRVFVQDPSDELRLGMPATVYVAVGGNARQAARGAESKARPENKPGQFEPESEPKPVSAR
ncbi:MAG TPA: efflux RND transporter periplasmic adaptor subunit [Gammaproteobacteria bacterium]|nr:efflux RND transporter periplasmic adaptor subunit [Gammaproteobacteria bacterium]